VLRAAPSTWPCRWWTATSTRAAAIVDGDDLPDGEPGELWVAATSTALHYWNQRERTKHTFVGQWLRTGDRYIRDADGF
jgi:acyl-CoA synthetase (AMP-forming)/AMP-acid ligase II